MWLIDIYILLTTRVPLPRMLFLFSIVTLSAYTVLASRTVMLKEMGFLVPIVCIILGHLAVITRKLPETLERLDQLGWANAHRRLFVVYLTGYAVALWLPSISIAQTALSLGIVIYLITFVGTTSARQDEEPPAWFAQTWDTGRENAENWHIARMVSLILLNESVRRFGTDGDWIIAMTLGPIALHYLMHWTILATHPYDDLDDEDRP